MKKLIAILCTALAVMTLLTGCWHLREKEYYADASHFITDTATVEHIAYDQDSGRLILWLTDISEVYSSSDFVVSKDSAALLMKNGVLDKVAVGDTITFISAPGCYSNGYEFPVVGLTVDGEELLSFDTGYKNLMAEY